MKKLIFNSTLNHKAHTYEPMQIVVEKVISLYGKRFEQLKTHPLDDVPELIENRDLMYIEGNTAHCVLFLDFNGSDGILVEAEGCGYGYLPKNALHYKCIFSSYHRNVLSFCYNIDVGTPTIFYRRISK